MKIQRGKVAPAALRLHRKMYSAFAEGDMDTIKALCTQGIADSFQARLQSRPKGERVEWDLLKYNKTPRVVSDRAARLPTDGFAVRQAVVKLNTRQRLTRYMRDGEVVPGSGKERDVVEYLVVQKLYRLWKEDPWKVWGTTEETTVQQLEKRDRKALEA